SAAKEAGNMVDLDSNPTKLIEIVEVGKQLLITRGSLTTFSIANDVAKYFAILPAMFAFTYATKPGERGPLDSLNVMNLGTPKSAIISAIVFNALIIPALVPLALRGHYRILLGMAAGVGKTYRMLQEGRQAQNDGRDVVIGYLEPHDRPETAALADGIQQVPRLRSEHGDLVLAEMDVDAVIARRPELALVDELAHSNAPGMRNTKRYEDIDEILAAGSDVISTVNIQHLESLNDTVAELTNVRVRETFPDRILDEADEVVLVDLTPEGLQERIRAGKVYKPDRVETALSNFFRADHLSSLRELALREVAEDVEERASRIGVLGDLSRQAVRERTLVLATPDPRSQRVVRRAWRSA